MEATAPEATADTVGEDTADTGGGIEVSWQTPMGTFSSHRLGRLYDRLPDAVKVGLSDVPVVGSLLRGEENRRYMSDYQRNTGLSAKYPVRAFGSFGYGSAIGQAVSTGRKLGKVYSNL